MSEEETKVRGCCVAVKNENGDINILAKTEFFKNYLDDKDASDKSWKPSVLNLIAVVHLLDNTIENVQSAVKKDSEMQTIITGLNAISDEVLGLICIHLLVLENSDKEEYDAMVAWLYEQVFNSSVQTACIKALDSFEWLSTMVESARKTTQGLKECGWDVKKYVENSDIEEKKEQVKDKEEEIISALTDLLETLDKTKKD